MIPVAAQVWGLRILFFGGLGLLPSAFGLTWGPNGLFLLLSMRDALRLPRSLVSVRPMEPVLYRLLGVGFVKRIVATRLWPLMLGWEPLPEPGNREALLSRIDATSRGAEVCHGATFILASVIALLFLIAGRPREAAWIIAFNVLLNGYPVMLQRMNRWRVQQIRAGACSSVPPSPRVMMSRRPVA
jgi:hypothetical protein